jgi:hypothetical protein
MTTLKGGKIFQLKLNDDGTSIETDPLKLFRSENRYQDAAFNPDGSTIYVITDIRGPVQVVKEGPITFTTEFGSPGSLMAFEYEGSVSARS